MRLPTIIQQLTQFHGAWIVGSAAEPGAALHSTRDIDVVVPYSQWHEASCLIPADAKRNRLGGWKYIREDIIVDIWPEDLFTLMCNDRLDCLWQPRLGIRYIKVNGNVMKRKYKRSKK